MVAQSGEGQDVQSKSDMLSFLIHATYSPGVDAQLESLGGDLIQIEHRGEETVLINGEEVAEWETEGFTTVFRLKDPSDQEVEVKQAELTGQCLKFQNMMIL